MLTVQDVIVEQVDQNARVNVKALSQISRGIDFARFHNTYAVKDLETCSEKVDLSSQDCCLWLYAICLPASTFSSLKCPTMTIAWAFGYHAEFIMTSHHMGFCTARWLHLFHDRWCDTLQGRVQSHQALSKRPARLRDAGRFGSG